MDVVMKATERNPLGFGTHAPLLIKALALTDGPALELGMGANSSYVMHWTCAGKKRRLVSYESNYEYNAFARRFVTDFHEVHFVDVDDWGKIQIEQPWDVALVDYDPSEHRIFTIQRLAPWVKYLIVHDTNARRERYYHYSKVWPLFKYQITFDRLHPHTKMVSNLVDLSDFSV